MFNPLHLLSMKWTVAFGQPIGRAKSMGRTPAAMIVSDYGLRAIENWPGMLHCAV
jgi:hypothetical protein